jgi:hypothetical protein
MDLKLLKDLNNINWPSQIKFNVGNDSIVEWQEPFFTIGPRTPYDFSGAINRYISNNPGLIDSAGNIKVPINITSASAGRIRMENIEIIVLPNASDPLDPDTDGDGIVDGLEVTGGTGLLDIDSDNDLLNDSSEQQSGGSTQQVSTTDDSDDKIFIPTLSGGYRIVNLSIPIGNQQVPGFVTSAKMNLTGQIYISGQFPSNAAFDVGDDGVVEWSQTGTFQTTISVPDFSGPINNYTFRNSNLIDSSGYINVPVNLSSTTDGNISMTNIVVQIDPDYSDPLNPDSDADELIDGFEVLKGTGRSDPDPAGSPYLEFRLCVPSRCFVRFQDEFHLPQ